MTLKTADKIIKDYYNYRLSKEEMNKVIEAFELFINEYNNPVDINELGAIYYRAKQYDLAEKYYLIAAEKGYLISISNLGYLYYYGRTGKIDYEKAFYWFNKASELGDIPAQIKIADMYKNGYFVEKDYEKYKSIIIELYKKISTEEQEEDFSPEILSRLGNIYRFEKRNEEAIDLLIRAKDKLHERLCFDSFFGNFSIMEYIVDSLFKCEGYQLNDIYDLFHFLKAKNKFKLSVGNSLHPNNEIDYYIESFDDKSIKIDNKIYSNAKDFFKNALLKNGDHIYSIYSKSYTLYIFKNNAYEMIFFECEVTNKRHIGTKNLSQMLERLNKIRKKGKYF